MRRPPRRRRRRRLRAGAIATQPGRGGLLRWSRPPADSGAVESGARRLPTTTAGWFAIAVSLVMRQRLSMRRLREALASNAAVLGA